MGIGFKIRGLLLLLSIGCIITALTFNKTQSYTEVLFNESKVLQNNLKLKEEIVSDFLKDSIKLKNAESFHLNGEMALFFKNEYANQNINLFTYQQNKLKFWSSISVVPPNIAYIKEGRSFLNLNNGYYEAIKFIHNRTTFLFIITIKNEFNLENEYLKNEISRDLSPSGLLDIANFNDPNDSTQHIKGLEGRYLFSVKLIPQYVSNSHYSFELWLYVGFIVFLALFVYSFSNWIVRRGYLYSGTILFTLFFVVLRLSDLEFGWFNKNFGLLIFDPKVYAQSYYLPSLGDLLLSTLAITWIILFIYQHRGKYFKFNPVKNSKRVSILFQILLLILFSTIAYFVDDVFFGLIYNSKIPFDINIFKLDWIGWLCVFLICIAWFNICTIGVIFAEFSLSYPLSKATRITIFLITLIAFSIVRIIIDFTAYYLIFALLMYLIGYNFYKHKRKFSILIFASGFFCMAFITSLKYVRYTDIRERSSRNNIAKKLINADDPQLLSNISVFEQEINNDEFILNYFDNPTSEEAIINHIEKKYLNDYLANFNFQIRLYNQKEEELGNHEGVPLQNYRNMVLFGALKTLASNYFYRVNDVFGYQNYFGVIPVFKNENIIGTVVVDLKSQPYNYNLRFPDLLVDSKVKRDMEFNKYSFAFYNNNQLVNQSGKISYPLANKNFKAETGTLLYQNDNNISHLVYAPTPNKLIIISKEKVDYLTRFSTLSFFFLTFMFFSGLVFIVVLIFKNIEDNAFNWFSINKYLMINANQILYRTRIQVSIILVVVTTLIVVGWTSFYYISKEFRFQQSDQIKEKIRKLQVSYEKLISKKGISLDQLGVIEFDQFADVNGVYLNLYNQNGDLLLTSLPRIYESGILAKKMDMEAFLNLKNFQNSEFINSSERVGDFIYATAYVPIKNVNNQTVAYLSSPFFENEKDYNSKIDSFINTLINIYALVFVIIGILAVFIANQITNPLTLIQESIRKTKLGSRNRPIQWSRQDEIGSLIKEYNKMIAALEESAKKLAKSERESAWREMAKQVAHEIKNPLTPLKLGVQLLERSWKEKDPNFEKKFENFSKSFTEQIDSLSTIASEFSNFAKMPDTKLENIELLPIIKKAVEVYGIGDAVEIVIINDQLINPVVLGDKDQLLRTFNNLFKNAIESIPDDEIAKIKVIVLKQEDKYIVSVNDNGRGISDEQKVRIFTPNFTTKTSGTGLGLAFVKQAIENAGGEVSFDSEVGKGTTFYLVFPVI